MKILVTGGTGFLGAALVRHLVREGHAVRVLDDGSRGRIDRLGPEGEAVEMDVGDVRDPTAVLGAVKGMDRVVHMAWVNGTRHFYENPGLVLDVGLRGTLHVVDACKRHGAELALASTSETYQSPSVVPTPEDVPLVVPDVTNPRYSYGGGKIAAELLALHSGLSRVVIFRPHNVYGPDMGTEHVIPALSLRIARLARESAAGVLDVPLLGTGEQVRAFVHVDDFTRALALVLDKGAHLGIYHLGNPEMVTIARLAERIGIGLDRKIRIVPSEPPRGETSMRCPDIAKLRALGFEPQIPLYEGLPPVVRWYAHFA